ncbi:hypothetical protein LCGC14_0817790 [marine sediment metagenome]|uniref:Uncharacterized protein n=1 Tax=marine sediment metagenome TaxID=412755 RepID=A0A0F9PJQ3_9ZZZZ|nr:hypothetical protein [Desulfobacterales bacterium]
MVEFGRQFGDMFKSVYDSDNNGVIGSSGVGVVTWINRGNLASFDWILSDFTIDVSWHDLDLSAIIPASTKLVGFRVWQRTTTVAVIFELRTKGNADYHNRSVNSSNAAFLDIHSDMWVVPDSNLLVEYRVSGPTDWTFLNVLIFGWFV